MEVATLLKAQQANGNVFDPAQDKLTAEEDEEDRKAEHNKGTKSCNRFLSLLYSEDLS